MCKFAVNAAAVFSVSTRGHQLHTIHLKQFSIQILYFSSSVV